MLELSTHHQEARRSWHSSSSRHGGSAAGARSGSSRSSPVAAVPAAERLGCRVALAALAVAAVPGIAVMKRCSAALTMKSR